MSWAGSAIHASGRSKWTATWRFLPPLVHIPAGTVQMGSSRWQVWWLTRRKFPAEDELPRHLVQVPEFSIGQFPVTNAEYACFVAVGGYRQEQWWRTAAALLAPRGDHGQWGSG